MKFRQVKETCLYVKDLHSTEKFYKEVLELEMIAFVENRHVFFRAGTSVLLFFNSESTAKETQLPPHYATGKQHVALEVELSAYENVKKQLLTKGIRIEHEHSWPNELRSFYFRDPDEHLLEIVPVGLWD